MVRFTKFEKDEKERREIDAKEYLHQQENKKEIVHQSNKQLYLNNDRIRQFQSKVL